MDDITDIERGTRARVVCCLEPRSWDRWLARAKLVLDGALPGSHAPPDSPLGGRLRTHLLDLGVALGQGFLMSRPLPEVEATELLVEHLAPSRRARIVADR